DVQRIRADARGDMASPVPAAAAIEALPEHGHETLSASWAKVALRQVKVPTTPIWDEHGKRLGLAYPRFTATLKGQVRWDVYRAELVVLLPMKTGVTWQGAHLFL